MKRGKVVDAETAELIAVKLSRLMVISDGSWSTARPVIWPEDLTRVAFDSAPAELDFNTDGPRRLLIHLICYDDEIYVLCCSPINMGERFAGCSIAQFRTDYDGVLLKRRPLLTFAMTSRDKRKYAEIYDGMRKDLKAKMPTAQTLDEVENLVIPDLITSANGEVDRLSNSRLLTLVQSAMLERFAFSPYTTIKQRPTFKQVMNPNPRQWPAFEIVSLRRPLKIEDPETTGRTINLRFHVDGHPRRIKTKDGEVKIIQVREHWRGPERAPVKPIIPKVYKVIR